MRASTHIVSGRFHGGEIEPGTFHGGKVEAGTFHAPHLEAEPRGTETPPRTAADAVIRPDPQDAGAGQ